MKPMTKSCDSLSDLFWPFNKSFQKNFMKADISKRKGNYVFDIEIPGFNKDSIKVQLKDGYLNVWTLDNKEEKFSEKDIEWILQERFDGEMSRSFYVGCSNEADVNATYHDGILTIVIPEDCNNQQDTKYINIR